MKDNTTQKYSVLYWAQHFNLETVKSELEILLKKKNSTINFLQNMEDEARLQFLIALALKILYPNLSVAPNYPIDLDGLPSSAAQDVNDQGDIECAWNDTNFLVEATLQIGSNQHNFEVWPIFRHLNKLLLKNKNSFCYFIAPRITARTKKQIAFIKETEGLIAYPLTILKFIEKLENNELLPRKELENNELVTSKVLEISE